MRNTTSKLIVSLFVPHAAVLYRASRKRKALLREREQRQAAAASSGLPATGFTYEGAVAFLRQQGLDPAEVRAGSMPEAALSRAVALILESASPREPLRILQVGAFVGISLAFLADSAVRHHPGSVVYSVDPNIAHRGVPDPQSTVLRLLNHFGLQRSCVLVNGYSLEKCLGDDGGVFYRPSEAGPDDYRRGSCENILPALEKTSAEAFDAVLIDGNHEPDYLTREVAVARRLLRRGGLLILDDISAGWQELHSVFRTWARDGSFDEVAADGRIGVLRRRS